MRNSLRKKPTYDEVINYLQVNQPKIKYPDRTATLLRNSHYLSQFDGNLFDVEEQQKKFSKAQLRESEIRNVVSQTQGTASLLRSEAAQEQNRETTKEATRTVAKNIIANAVAKSTAQRFDISKDDDKADEAMEQADAQCHP